jgi:hypothetical protein
MAAQKNPTTGIRFTEDDRRLVKQLRKKLGVELTQIMRLALRALATKEGISA